MGNKIVVTGATGFLGSRLTTVFRQQKRSVAVFDKQKHDIFKPESIKELLADAAVVIHLLGANRDTQENLLYVNVLGTANLLVALSHWAPGAKLVFASSAQVLWRRSFYGVTKRLAEEMVEYYTRATKLTAVILRIANIYGPGGKPFYNSVIATFAHQIQQDKPVTIHGDGEQKRDYVYVDDVTEAVIRSIDYQGNTPCELIDICSGKGVTLNTILDLSEQILGKKNSRGYKKAPPYEEPYRPQDPAKAQKTLGWKPTVSLDEGLRRTLTGAV